MKCELHEDCLQPCPIVARVKAEIEGRREEVQRLAERRRILSLAGKKSVGQRPYILKKGS